MKKSLRGSLGVLMVVLWGLSISAEQRVLRPPKPLRTASPAACSELTAAETSAPQLLAKIADAQIAYLHLRSEEDYIGPQSRRCEAVIYAGFDRLSRLESPAAAEALASLANDPDMLWNFADLPALSTAIAGGMGPMVLSYLRPLAGKSVLASEAVRCIGAGHDNCM